MARPPSDHPRPTLSTFQALAVASQFGVTLAVCVVLGVLAGQWLDSRLNTGIIFTLIGVLVGLATAGTSTVRLYRATMRKSLAPQPPAPHTATDAQTQTTESARHAATHHVTRNPPDADDTA
jgi:F0F1-type ATP synthase assembly protein I